MTYKTHDRFALLMQANAATFHIEAAAIFAAGPAERGGEADPAVLTELERTLALLAFDEPPSVRSATCSSRLIDQKVASELNAAILKIEHQEPTTPRLYTLIKLILWSQDELDKKKVKYPKMTDLGSGTIESPK
ncbi:hypothetical protein LSTR_LSTR015617 [Laodelphax striatellus]|uniref:CRA domain-containing protein n=1 Tax=Laodelphax striatellus TaxID=195883 RepID=A0A482XEP5_LAOST|nr:hypothetical protein LSTR_LSTR015617 [Laodelphax striatellus]